MLYKHALKDKDELTVTYNGIVTTNGAWSGSQWVGGTEENYNCSQFTMIIYVMWAKKMLTTPSLYHLFTLPDHGTDWARKHVLNQTLEEGLAREVGICSS